MAGWIPQAAPGQPGVPRSLLEGQGRSRLRRCPRVRWQLKLQPCDGRTQRFGSSCFICATRRHRLACQQRGQRVAAEVGSEACAWQRAVLHAVLLAPPPSACPAVTHAMEGACLPRTPMPRGFSPSQWASVLHLTMLKQHLPWRRRSPFTAAGRPALPVAAAGAVEPQELQLLAAVRRARRCSSEQAEGFHARLLVLHPGEDMMNVVVQLALSAAGCWPLHCSRSSPQALSPAAALQGDTAVSASGGAAAQCTGAACAETSEAEQARALGLRSW
mmetsp:Transcript_130619/g.237534  ORF Transcript_130619/g.237534 Transcript_130619/m.237534 type:complete len:274 (+) Transcript_130619:1437-2258(+)